MRTRIIAANWKMNLGRVGEATAFIRQIRYPLSQIQGVECVLCPPFTVLSSAAQILGATRIALGAQTMHWEPRGAFTGEISPAMLCGICRYVIVGHSERRSGRMLRPEATHETVGEQDSAINSKVRAAVGHRLRPIICVGENLAQREANETHLFVEKQVRSALEGLTSQEALQCVMAYEPIWAIGTGKAATPVDANRVIGLSIRGAIADLFGESVAQKIRVQYGGSVNATNIADFVAMPEIDGALVGGASLTPDFVELVKNAASSLP